MESPRQSLRPVLRVTQAGWRLRSFAVITLLIPIVSFIVMWPIPALGFTVDFQTGTVLDISPDSPAARAHVQTGDHILSIYDYAWSDVDHVLLLPLPWQTGLQVPLIVARNEKVYHLRIPTGSPTAISQSEKLAGFLLALIYWLTGTLFSLVSRYETRRATLVAWSWLGLAALLGAYPLALNASIVLTVVLHWALLTLWMPLAVIMHVWYPVRPVVPRTRRNTLRGLIGALLVLQVSFLSLWASVGFDLVALSDHLIGLTAIGLGAGFLFAGALLWQAYRTTTITAIRRQIRLIAIACCIVAFTWTGLRSVPLVLGIPPLLPGAWIDLISGLVPLAYLAGWLLTDLYRVDHVLQRVARFTATLVIVSLVAAGVLQALGWSGMAATVVLAFGVIGLYIPAQQLISALFPDRQSTSQREALAHTSYLLTTTLDQTQLISVLMDGLRTAFAHPPLAIYLSDPDEPHTMRIVDSDRLIVPTQLSSSQLLLHLPRTTLISDTRDVHALVSTLPLTEAETILLHAPGIALWCPIRQQDGHLLGLLLIGIPGDLEPYRKADLHDLTRLLDAAHLALANSATYVQRQQAEEMIRQLYQSLQRAQDTTSTWIAREIHDEAINVQLRHLALSLDHLASSERDPTRRAELSDLVLACGATSDALRLICEDIYPLGIDDPHGLHLVLQRQARRLLGRSAVSCQVDVSGKIRAVPSGIQWEAVRIMREAITNALKHSVELSSLHIVLSYPEEPDGLLTLGISDDGRGEIGQLGRKGGLGLRSMQESARTVGGQLSIRRGKMGGVEVCFAVVLPAERISLEQTATTASA